jgi:hypothetical protein
MLRLGVARSVLFDGLLRNRRFFVGGCGQGSDLAEQLDVGTLRSKEGFSLGGRQLHCVGDQFFRSMS